MGYSTKIVTKHYAQCDWCEVTVETTACADRWGDNAIPIIPSRWEEDWDTYKKCHTIYCSEIHMKRARQVAELKLLP